MSNRTRSRPNRVRLAEAAHKKHTRVHAPSDFPQVSLLVHDIQKQLLVNRALRKPYFDLLRSAYETEASRTTTQKNPDLTAYSHTARSPENVRPNLH